MLGIVGKNVLQLSKPMNRLENQPSSNLPPSDLTPSDSQVAGKLKTVRTAPGMSYDYIDELSKDRSHSFAFWLDQTRNVSIDIANDRNPGLFGELLRSRNIEVTLWSESGQKQDLFSVAPGDRDRETITLKSGRYLLELKTHTSKKIDYALKLTPMKWLMLGCFAS
jgi:hypothetical protein